MKAPLSVQLNRVVFAVYAMYFSSFLWNNGHGSSFEGWLVLGGLTFFSLLGFIYTCVRAPHSRWILAVLDTLIPAFVFVGMCLMIWSRPEAWWDWLLCLTLGPIMWFSLPVVFAVILFKDKKAGVYFTSLATNNRAGVKPH
jgi:hypothetical protein